MEYKSKNTRRESNIELFRLVLMFMIVMLHLFGDPQIRLNFGNPKLFISELLILSLTINAVNAFVFISGYYGIKFKLKSFLGLICQVLFYSLVITSISKLFGEPISIKQLIGAILPVSSGIWWFISSYIALYLVAPLLNKGLELLNKTQNKILVLGLLFLNTTACFIFENEHIGNAGSSFFNFIVIYVIARYISKYNILFKYPLFIYLGCSLVCFALNYFVSNSNEVVFPTFRYANPLLILSAASLFLFFKGLKPFYNNFINNIAKLSLGVYLIHVHPFIFGKLHELVSYVTEYFSNSILLILTVIFVLCIIVFVSTLFVDYIRLQILAPIVNQLNTAIAKRIKTD